jgi:hypothetical protein
MLTGKCLCGAVSYEVADAFVYAANCHCSNCRRATGSAFKPFAGIESGKLRIVEGRDRLMIFGDPAAHIFVGSKAPWYAIADDLPQYEEHAPDGG